MSISVGPPDPDEFLVMDAYSSWVMFSKMTLSGLVSSMSIMADCFGSAAFGCISLSFFLMSVVISCFLSMSLAWSTKLWAFSLVFVTLIYRNLSGLIVFGFGWSFESFLNGFILWDQFLQLSVFLPFHSFVQVFDMFSVFLILSDGFWSSSGKCIATRSHLLLLLKSLIRRDTSAISVFPTFPLGICISFFFHLTIFWYAQSRLFLIFFKSFILPHVIHVSQWVFPYFGPCSYRITIAMRYSLYKISDIVHSTFQHICSDTIFCTLHRTAVQGLLVEDNFLTHSTFILDASAAPAAF